ncbi:hypothetical protein SAY87_027780 [Trapa incisa]|uniref:Polygalacturonase n=1 Tax=Trapa incisa TaxID=236973 RepID=A0AAN7PKL0_9MYRT|nr:hypothetical protein SAY87_027780 [Trapa incisa]
MNRAVRTYPISAYQVNEHAPSSSTSITAPTTVDVPTNSLSKKSLCVANLLLWGVKISGVTYKNIRGTSATPEAVTFECSTSNHCTGIHLQDVNLMYMNKAATSSCSNVRGTSTRASVVLGRCLSS